jgi:hypothetical protein
MSLRLRRGDMLLAALTLLASATTGFRVGSAAWANEPASPRVRHSFSPHYHIGTIHGPPRDEDYCTDTTKALMTESQLATRVGDTILDTGSHSSEDWNHLGQLRLIQP